MVGLRHGTPGVGDCMFYNPFISGFEGTAVPGGRTCASSLSSRLSV